MAEVQVLLEKADPNMTEGTVLDVLRKEGDHVSAGDILANVETEKVVIEVEAKSTGVLKKILVKPGDMVPVAAPIAIIETVD